MGPALSKHGGRSDPDFDGTGVPAIICATESECAEEATLLFRGGQGHVVEPHLFKELSHRVK